jgi:putative redox protein
MPNTPTGKPAAVVHVTWRGDQRFDAGRPGGPTLRLDGRGETGQSPVDALMTALAACTAVDVTMILEKRRTPLEALEIDAIGQRASTTPARVTTAELTYHLRGTAVERVHAERAVELAITKYCSVRDSLDPQLPITYRVVLNGDWGELITAGAAAA